jgi:Bacterial regulatory proteins, luxR family
LNERVATKPIRLALSVADTQLAERLGALLAGVPGLQLVAPGETADATVVLATAAVVDGEVLLTPRELEVLALLAEGASNKTIARRLTLPSFMSDHCSTSSMRLGAPTHSPMLPASG